MNLEPDTIHGFTSHTHEDDVALLHMRGRVYDYALGRFLSVDPVVANPLSSQSSNPYSYLGNNPLSGTDPTGYDCQEDNGGKVDSACLLSNNGVNKVTDSNGKTVATVIALDKGDTVSGNLSNGGSFSATFTGKAGDISRLLTGSGSSDIGSISKTTNGALDGVTASYANGQDKSSAHVIDLMAEQQRAQQEADFEAYRQWTSAHEALDEPLDDVLKLHPLVGGANAIANCVSGECSGANLATAAIGAVLPEVKVLAPASRGLATTANEAVFWSGIRSGDTAAGSWVAKQGGATLETTLAARGIRLPTWNPSNAASVAAWRQASLDFARGASGDVRVLQSDLVRINSIWAEVEFPALKANPNVSSILSINTETGAEALLWSR